MRSIFYLALAAGHTLANPLKPAHNNEHEANHGLGRGVVEHPPNGPPPGHYDCSGEHGYPPWPTITTIVVLTITLTPPASSVQSSTFGSPSSSAVVPTHDSSSASSTITTTSTTVVSGTSTVTQTSTFITSSTPPSSAPASSYTITGSVTATQATCSSTVSPPAPTQPGVVSGCTKWHVAVTGDTCDIISKKYSITLNTFYIWNPAVMDKCTSLLKGDAYCIEVCGNSALTSISTTFSPLPSATNCANLPALTQGPKDKYKAYCGDGSVGAGWPAISDWLDFKYLFDQNMPSMKASCANFGVDCDSDAEIASMKKSIVQVANSTGVDARFILAIIMQESTGCVRVISSKYSHLNPGLMQSWNGKGSCNSNQAALGLPGTSITGVKTPCPYFEIHQMIMDGTAGTPGNKDSGLQQNLKQTGYSGAQAYYGAAKIYNGGIASFSANKAHLESGCCTDTYISDIANRLMGWVTATRDFTC